MRSLSEYLGVATRIAVAASAILVGAAISTTHAGDGWQEIGGGVDGIVHAFLNHEGRLVVAGNFRSAGGNPFKSVADWDDATQQWRGYGSGMNRAVRGVATYGGGLAAGGLFGSAGGTQAKSVALWDGVNWNALSDGANQNVYAVAVYNGDLIVGGSFTSPGSRIARWDGQQWHPLGSGVTHDVLALHVHDGLLIVGGKFGTAGGISAKRVAAWDGSNWHAFGDGLNAYVRALTTWNGTIVAGGDTLLAPGGSGQQHVAQWNASSQTWTAVGAHFDGRVRALVEHDGDLIAGGEFTLNDGGEVNRIARWNGQQWQAMSTGMNDTVWALAVYNNDLIAGGEFTAPAGRIARWGDGGGGGGEPIDPIFASLAGFFVEPDGPGCSAPECLTPLEISDDVYVFAGSSLVGNRQRAGVQVFAKIDDGEENVGSVARIDLIIESGVNANGVTTIVELFNHDSEQWVEVAAFGQPQADTITTIPVASNAAAYVGIEGDIAMRLSTDAQRNRSHMLRIDLVEVWATPAD